MQARLPSIKTLSIVFGDKARDARAILEMSRAELEALPAGAALLRQCWNPPMNYELRLYCLDALGESFGVEGFKLNDGSFCDYLNTGDAYAPTLLRVNGRYRVGCWGDIAERMA